MKNSPIKFIVNLVLLAIFIFTTFQYVNAQKKMDGIERDRMKTMLKNIKNWIEDEYYDTNYHGINLDERFKQAEDRLKQVDTVAQAFAVIAQILIDFNDSHLYFLPPLTNLDVEYGWRASMSGDKLFVTTVKPKSDAEAKGLKIGDQILMVENFKPVKSEMWKVNYYYNTLSKRPGLNLTVLSPGESTPRKLAIESKVYQRPKVIDKNTFFQLIDMSGKPQIEYHLFIRTGGLAIWKMPTFSFNPSDVGTLVGKIENSSGLILDLRGNGGGYVDTLEKLAGYMFDKDLRIAELKGRKELKPQESKTQGDNSYKGKLVVLIDSESGSAAEIFARLVQLEKRGVVLGDVSAGAVMQSRGFTGTMSNDSVIYGASITNADVIMSDGKSLEHVGVIPDETVLITGKDLAEKRDPVIARAAEILGVKMSPEQAGSFFKYEWKKDAVYLELAK